MTNWVAKQHTLISQGLGGWDSEIQVPPNASLLAV